MPPTVVFVKGLAAQDKSRNSALPSEDGKRPYCGDVCKALQAPYGLSGVDKGMRSPYDCRVRREFDRLERGVESVLSGMGEEAGQGLTEYALILLLIALVLIVMLTVFGDQISNTYQYIISRFAS